MKYLGVLIHSRKLRTTSFQPLIDKVRKKIRAEYAFFGGDGRDDPLSGHSLYILLVPRYQTTSGVYQTSRASN